MTEQAPQEGQGQEKSAPEAAGSYDQLFKTDTPELPTDSLDTAGAGVRPVSRAESHPVATEVDQMMGLNAADRKNREAAGLPPRELDLK